MHGVEDLIRIRFCDHRNASQLIAILNRSAEGAVKMRHCKQLNHLQFDSTTLKSIIAACARLVCENSRILWILI